MIDYTQFKDYIEFKDYGKKSTIVCDMFIKVDEDNKILLSSNIVDREFIDTSSQGILKEVNSYIAKKIEDKLNINIVDYGVEVFDECVSAANEEIK